MPTYGFKCKKCEHSFEQIMPIGSPKPKRCPNCRGKLVRAYRPPSLKFKGKEVTRKNVS